MADALFSILGEVVTFGPDRQKPTGAGATPIPGGTGPHPLPDLLVVIRSPGVRQDAPTPPVTGIAPKIALLMSTVSLSSCSFSAMRAGTLPSQD